MGDHIGVQPLIDPPVRGELGGHLVVGVPAHDHGVDPLEQTGVGLHPLLRLPMAAQPVHAACASAIYPSRLMAMYKMTSLISTSALF